MSSMKSVGWVMTLVGGSCPGSGVAVNVTAPAVGELWKDLDLVATTDLGGMVEPRNFSRWYAKCAKRAGLEDTGTHVLRHHFVTRGVHEGSSAVDVSKVVGHSSPAFTLNQYANAIEEGQRRAVESVARSLGLGS